ncbi:hypothetical protein [Phocaeicola salanitronis]|uniref:hypothetical protein n=1 Tax=Phocaeicola salanitronis TaxID=376805 RepID=UPI0023F88BFA|nr:hypothetical protein [Phocaeicola salanitronis]
MKDLYILPECYIDTNLVETLISTEGCNHQKGCNTVVGKMDKLFADKFAVGIIDRDKRQVRYVNNFHEIISTESLLLMKHNERPHYLIMVSPAMDGFILKCADEVQLKPEDYGFPSDLKAFTTFTKSVTSKNASEFKKLFKDLRNASELKTLRGWLEYLRTNQYKSKEEDLKSMVSR